MRLRFGDCVYDADTREVLRGDEFVAVSPKAFALLGMLIASRPAAVSKANIHARLWPGGRVSDQNLVNLVVELRAALGDDARRPRIIRTLPRFGYAFRAATRTERPTRGSKARRPERVYSLVWGRREIELEPGENLIGRAQEAVVWIDDESVSRRHARIAIGPEGARLEDLGSMNGTYLGGRKIRGPVWLADHDALKIGPATLSLRIVSPTGSTRSTRSKPRQ